MAKRKLPATKKKRVATRKVNFHRRPAEELARNFIRRRIGVLAPPASDSVAPLVPPIQKFSADSLSSDVEPVSDQSSSDGQSVIKTYNPPYHTAFKFGSAGQPWITSVPLSDYLKFSVQDKTTATPLTEYLTYLVQEKKSLLNLELEATSHLLQDKFKELREKYTSFRRVLGDGNCFFRAFKFAYLERILLMKDMEEAIRIFAKMTELKDRILHDNMTPSETFMSDYDAFYNMLQLVSPSSENSISHAVLLEWSKDENGYSDPAIRFLRLVTSCEIRSRSKHFEEGILGLSCDTTMTVQKFCEIEVEPMGRDVDNVQIAAFVDALGVPIRIEYVSDNKHRLNHFDFGIEASPLAEPYIALLYRPGHYDILYTNEYHKLVPEPISVVLNDSKTPEKKPILKEPKEDASIVSDTSEEELKAITKDPATSEMDPIDKGKVMRLNTLHTYIRRKQKETDE